MAQQQARNRWLEEFSPAQWGAIERSGGELSYLEDSGLFSPDELDALGAQFDATTSKGSSGGSSSNPSDPFTISQNKIFALANRLAGQKTTQSTNAGLQYEGPDVVGAGGASSGPSPVLIVGGLAAAGAVAWWYFHRKHRA